MTNDMLVILENLPKSDLLLGVYFLFIVWGMVRLDHRNQKRKRERIAQQKENNELIKEFVLDKGHIEFWWGYSFFL